MSKAKILVVDDEKEMLEMLRKLIKTKVDVDCFLCSSGKEALEYATSVDFDLVVLDIQMPGMDGYEVCRILKNSEKTKNIPVLFLTARTDTLSKIKAFEIGAVDYISKPFPPEEAIARIHVHLRLKQSQEENLRCKEALYQLRYLDIVNSMVQGFSHNFNNLFTILCNQIGLLERIYLERQQEKHPIFEGISQTIERIVNLIGKLESFAINKRNDCELLDLSLVLEKTLESFSSSLPANIEIHKCLEKDLPKVQMPFSLLHQILCILLTNAKESVEDTRGILTIQSWKEKAKQENQEKERVCLKIQDNGKGISEENKKHLFEPFFTTKNTVGVGLGLCMAYTMMKKYNGDIQIESEENKGTIVKLYFSI
ncbi:MAG: response regulator [Candidatus Brocadiae bacterium]|nr:response regulator [Candidatus Brocadiia bacterium]